MITRKTKQRGQGVFATRPIKKGEIIAEFDGKIYQYDHAWNRYLENHAIQIGSRRWRDSKGIATSINHSCKPNCGIKRDNRIVAMRNINAGEEITWDYAMTENDPWRMKCKCGSDDCRGIIGAYRMLSQEQKKKYKSYTSSWILKSQVKK